jgi:hypothetical protein
MLVWFKFDWGVLKNEAIILDQFWVNWQCLQGINSGIRCESCGYSIVVKLYQKSEKPS